MREKLQGENSLKLPSRKRKIKEASPKEKKVQGKEVSINRSLKENNLNENKPKGKYSKKISQEKEVTRKVVSWENKENKQGKKTQEKLQGKQPQDKSTF